MLALEISCEDFRDDPARILETETGKSRSRNRRRFSKSAMKI
jgi:hypothetical protein